MKEITIAISGQICRENSANLHSFWSGFINIQKALNGVENVKVVAHSWNPEFDDIVNKVYKPEAFLSEKQNSFVSEYMPLIKPVDKFENGFKRYKSTWWKINPNMLSGQITSKTRSIELLDKLGLDDEDVVLSTRWDIGCSGGEKVNQIVFDASLPGQYLYLAYFPYVDEGYADMWYWGAYKNIKVFSGYKSHFHECLSGQNSYFSDFTEKGWFRSCAEGSNSASFKSLIEGVLRRLVVRVPFKFLEAKMPFGRNKIKGLKLKVDAFLNRPSETWENSFPEVECKKQTVYPIESSLNIHAMLKHFIEEKKLRANVRFLDVNDFNTVNNPLLINPIDFCYVIYSHSSFADCWKMAIQQAKENLPENCKKIYLVSESSKETLDSFREFDGFSDLELIEYEDGTPYTERLKSVYQRISISYKTAYFVHEDMPLIEKVDKAYLNALLHYLQTSNEYYIKLVDTSFVDKKSVHSSFPELVENVGGYSLSVQPSLMKLEDMTSFLSNFNCDIYSFEQMCVRSNFKASAVSGTKTIGKYLIVNSKFPHVATAISKGKWCTDEWPEEIVYLAEKYSIDLSIRGEVNNG